MKKILFSLFLLFLTSCSFFGAVNVEKSKFNLLEKSKNFEIRKYSKALIIQSETEEDYKASMNKNFRKLFKYIQGSNLDTQKISMTAPVTMQKKISINKESLIQEKSIKGWKMSFVLPSKFNISSAPEPEDKSLTLIELPEKVVAVYRFNGRLTKKSIDKNVNILKNLLQERDIKVLSSARSAGYNPPWTIPFYRSNEIQIDIEYN